VKFKISLKDENEFEQLVKELSESEFRSSADELTGAVTKEAGERLHAKIVGNFQNGRPDWPALSQVTAELKGHAQPLVDSGMLLRNITLTFVGETALVGIPDGAQYPDGTEVDLVASVMEDGAVIRVTERMRNFFAARGFPLRKETEVIMIPARPFFEPAVKELEDELPEILEEVFEKGKLLK